MTSVLLVFQLGQPRIFMAMARDGLLPQYFARIHPRFRTPHITTIWTGIFVGGVAMIDEYRLTRRFDQYRNLVRFRTCCASASSFCDAPTPQRPVHSASRGYQCFQFSASCLCIVLMCSLPLILGAGFSFGSLIGLLIYFLYSVRHSKLRHGIDAGPTEDQPPPLIKT